jgi:hypothetical protein
MRAGQQASWLPYSIRRLQSLSSPASLIYKFSPLANFPLQKRAIVVEVTDLTQE